MNKSISPSLICTDLCNLESSVRQLEISGCDMLHIDLLDGYFSPSMPIGLDMVRQLRKKTNLYFDAHVMAVDNTFFMEQLADIGVGRMCFQIETERHISRKLSWMKECGIEAGIALAPATPVSGLKYVLEQCDFVLLMMINPGYASSAGEKLLSGMKLKIEELNRMIKDMGLSTSITIDGRTYLDVIPEYIRAGAETFVAGTSSLFRENDKSIKENFELMHKTIEEAKKEVESENDN